MSISIMNALGNGRHGRVKQGLPNLSANTGGKRITHSEIAEIDLAGQRCKVLIVDGVTPMHHSSRGNKGVRLTYAEGEIAHFHYQGHVFAIVRVESQAALTEAPRDESTAAQSDVRRMLTSRELQIVQMLSMGLLTKQVANRLRISEFTVRSYVKTIYAKLGVRSRAAMVRCYMQAFSAYDGAGGVSDPFAEARVPTS